LNGDPIVIGRAMIACENSGHSVTDDFPEVRKIVEAGATNKTIKDYELSRYACYLIVQNGDPRKEVIALGQTYFAIQTYRQEVADRFNQLDEDRRRLVVRGDIKQWNQLLAETAHEAGVITNEEFAIFHRALKRDGVLYASWKYGEAERCDGERFYCDMTEEKLRRVLARAGLFDCLECWVAEDSLPSGREQKWLNVMLGKKVSCKRG